LIAGRSTTVTDSQLMRLIYERTHTKATIRQNAEADGSVGNTANT